MAKQQKKGELAAAKSQQEIEVLGERWLKAKAAKEVAEAELKEAESLVKTYAEAHAATLFTESNTAKVAGLKISVVNETKLNVPKDLNVGNFYNRFPSACKLEIQKVVIKTLALDTQLNEDLKRFGVEITTEDKITIAKA